ncbi:aldehyde-activating protein [Veronia nyctiphanis]|uniref:Aldehyde-activating protein n=1 Tax=Veronia nyctiphanis TaxID=1278244 RepID=A0A4Q0YQ98_9GAMM|nr:GFA family protein [Veronia nyctiphanis]RXJ73186.1 aldehyde-activating protein [Veronia nyctiphanis]
MRGSCLCGEIEYEVNKLDSPIQHCSCHTCRKAHAAAFNSTAAVLKSDFRWLKGDALLSHFESSPGKKRFFCSKCGTQLVKENEGQLSLRVATLNDDPNLKPQFRIWSSHEVPWLTYPSDIPAYDEWESSKG